VVGAIQLTPEELKRYKDVPVTRMIDNGFYIFPPTSQGVVKFAIHQKGYLNPRDGLSSVPRTALTRGYENQRVPENAHKALLAGLKRVYPELAAKEWLTSRLCWYSDRPSGDWLIDYHPAYKNLFIAAGCCGHAFKFLPILGRLIVQGINRQLPTELADVWAFHHRVEGRKDESRSFSVYHRLDVPANVSRL
jgi:sarcosine oxidase/L-pipecolate oxidase